MQWRMLQQEKPEDYVIATGRQESVRRFIELSAEKLGWSNGEGKSIYWEGEGLNEVGYRADNGQPVIRIDKRYFRPTEVQSLLGDPTKAKKKLGWEPKTTLEELISEMIENDREESLKETLLNKKGFKVNPSLENPPNI